MQDYNAIFNFIAYTTAGVIISFLGYSLRKFAKRVDELEIDINKLKLEIAKDYVSKVEIFQLEQQFIRHFERVDNTMALNFQNLNDKIDKLTFNIISYNKD
jgi:hypothetical protein